MEHYPRVENFEWDWWAREWESIGGEVYVHHLYVYICPVFESNEFWAYNICNYKRN